MNGGDRVAESLERHGVRFLFTLCGGHISPILVSAHRRGIRVVDVRHEATAVFAADAVGRLTGEPGVAVVTAGPGATNTVTAVKNAQMAQSPLVLLVGATATLLRGRGALQDMDQKALLSPHVKWMARVDKVASLAATMDQAFAVARSGVPGPVAVECPVDLLYPEDLVRQWYRSAAGKGLGGHLRNWYLQSHARQLFGGARQAPARPPLSDPISDPSPVEVRRAAKRLSRAKRPILLVGSQALADAPEAWNLARALKELQIPTYLSGMARGLLGPSEPLQLRHRRREALREADTVILAGVPCDFRLDYGRPIPRKAHLIAVNRSEDDLRRNRKPSQGVLADPGRFLQLLAWERTSHRDWSSWQERLADRDREREEDMREQERGEDVGEGIHPRALCQAIEDELPANGVLVADGGDFVATASYVVRPRAPLGWLDPGPFGTLGVGAGFALGTKLCRPDSEVWILYGDGSLGYSLVEIDTFYRHRVPVLAVVGNDAAWSQIAREQVEVLEDDVGTVLNPTPYHLAAQGLGAQGFEITSSEGARQALREARLSLADGTPALVNALMSRSAFRKGSISL